MNEPSPQDVADTITATYRELHRISSHMTRVMSALWLTQIMLALVFGVFAFYLLRKATASVTNA